MHNKTNILLLTCRIDLSDSIDTNFTSIRPGISELRVVELWKVPRHATRFFALHRDLDDAKQPAVLT